MSTKAADDYPAIAKRLAELEAERREVEQSKAEPVEQPAAAPFTYTVSDDGYGW